MSYTALYRKWRPVTFEDVKGQDHIVKTLKNQITSGRIGHAYLFCGTRGTGKTSIAKIFARAVNCENPQEGSPCNQCPTCQAVMSGSSLNVVEIDAASNNGVENIREIREQVQYPPTEGRYRVYIIDEVHMLSTGAFNALLKTLEEPPSYVIFILATTEAHKIPVTVLSRCQRYDFKRITLPTLTARLKELTDAEQIEVEEKALAYIARAADGSMRDALSLLDQCAAFHYGKCLSYDNVLEVLGAVDHTVFSNLFRAVTKGDTKSCIYQLEEMIVQGRELGQFVNDFIWYMRNLLLIMTTDDAESMLDMSEDNIKLLREEAGLINTEILMRYIRVFSELSNQIRYASQKRVLIELAFIRLTKPQMEENLDSVMQRLSELENRLDEGLQKGCLFPPIDNAALPHMETGAEAGPEAVPAVDISPRQVSIPKEQLDDFNQLRNEWAKIIREIGGSIRASFRNTVIEPAGADRMCVVFSTGESFDIGSRPAALEEIGRFVEQKFGKSIAFQARLAGGGERFDTIYVSEEELKANIHMDITIED
ncbi:DNA polymerase III subunit gamma/tau [Lachnospiraceae bacterium 62-35]